MKKEIRKTFGFAREKVSAKVRLDTKMPGVPIILSKSVYTSLANQAFLSAHCATSRAVRLLARERRCLSQNCSHGWKAWLQIRTSAYDVVACLCHETWPNLINV